jgi:hypothetical protein
VHPRSPDRARRPHSGENLRPYSVPRRWASVCERACSAVRPRSSSSRHLQWSSCVRRLWEPSARVSVRERPVSSVLVHSTSARVRGRAPGMLRDAARCVGPGSRLPPPRTHPAAPPALRGSARRCAGESSPRDPRGQIATYDHTRGRPRGFPTNPRWIQRIAQSAVAHGPRRRKEDAPNSHGRPAVLGLSLHLHPNRCSGEVGECYGVGFAPSRRPVVSGEFISCEWKGDQCPNDHLRLGGGSRLTRAEVEDQHDVLEELGHLAPRRCERDLPDSRCARDLRASAERPAVRPSGRPRGDRCA